VVPTVELEETREFGDSIVKRVGVLIRASGYELLHKRMQNPSHKIPLQLNNYKTTGENNVLLQMEPYFLDKR